MYTWQIEYETYSKLFKEWMPAYFRTTDDAVRMHIQALAAKELDGTHRNVKVTPIGPPTAVTLFNQD